MNVRNMVLAQTPDGSALVTLVLDAKPDDLSETFMKVQEGKRYTCEIKPFRRSKSDDQRAAIWAKITDLASVMRTSNDEMYEACVRKYGPGYYLRVERKDLEKIAGLFRIVDVKREHGDKADSVTAIAYKGLSQMDTAEASRLLDGVLSECREVGLSGEIE